MKLLILGAAGEMCTPATMDLVNRKIFDQVTLTDINFEKLKKMATELKVEESAVKELDARSPEQIRALMKGHEIVVNGLPKPFAFDVLEACIEQKVCSCDLGSPNAKMLSLNEQAKAAGISYVAGMGATPGVTNLMAKHAHDLMDEIDQINVSFAAMRPFALSPALLDTILWEFEPELPGRAYYKDGEFYPVPPFAGEKIVDFPEPIGRQKVYFVPHGETRTFPANFGAKRVFVRGTFPPKDMRLMRSLLEYGFFDETPIQIDNISMSPKSLMKQALLQMPEATVKEKLYSYGLEVEIFGCTRDRSVKRTYWITMPGMDEWSVPFAYSNAVGLPLGVCAQLLAEGKVKTGVNAPEALIEPEVFFAELAKRKILVHYKEETL